MATISGTVIRSFEEAATSDTGNATGLTRKHGHVLKKPCVKTCTINPHIMEQTLAEFVWSVPNL